MEIRANIESTNKRTRAVKRGKKGSEAMYEREKHNTFAEMKSTVEAKIIAGGSRRRGKFI